MGKRNYSSLPHLNEDVARLVEDFDRETDRGVALLGAAFLDDVLDVLIRAFLVDQPDAVSKLMGAGRPLESFGSRAHLAFCVGLLGRDVYHDINLIREIRNDFAHRQPTTFNQSEIRLKCERLKTVKLMLPDESCGCRERFIVAVVLIANHLLVAAETQEHQPLGKDFSENGVLRLK